MPKEDLRLTCIQIEGRLVEWYFNGKIIDENTETGFSTNSNRDETLRRITSELEKSKISVNDSGTYSCRALPDPRYGTERSQYSLEVKVTDSKYWASAIFLDVVHFPKGHIVSLATRIYTIFLLYFFCPHSDSLFFIYFSLLHGSRYFFWHSDTPLV